MKTFVATAAAVALLIATPAFAAKRVAQPAAPANLVISGDKVIGDSDSKVKPNSQKAFEKAVEAYKKWLAANPNDDVGWFNLGRAYAKLSKDEEAECDRDDRYRRCLW